MQKIVFALVILSIFSNYNIAKSDSQVLKPCIGNVFADEVMSREINYINSFKKTGLKIEEHHYPVVEKEVFFPVLYEGSYYSSKYGYRRDPKTGESTFHHGVDIYAPNGIEIVATHRGEIVFANNQGDYGNLVMVKAEVDSKIFIIHYAHLDSILTEKGDSIDAGSVIGTVGSSGRVTGPHLHYEVREENGKSVDPIKNGFLPKEVKVGK